MTRVNITYPVDALVSYHYYAKESAMAPLVETGRLRLIGDSGAFSALSQGAPIDLDAYAAWVTRWRQHLCWAASLDVIGDPVRSHRNWLQLRDRHHLATVPTLHAGSDMSWMDAYASEGVDFMGLGGMAGPSGAGRAYRWAVQAFRYARDKWPAVRFHLWGVTNRQFLDHLPAYSADSSGILGAAYRFAQLRVFDPATGKHHQVALRAGQRAVYGLAPLLRRTYGVEPAQIETSHPSNRITLIQLAAASTQQYAAWLQRRHQVTAPTWGLADGPSGSRVHLAGNGFTSPSGNSLYPLAHPEQPGGPRLHVVAADKGKPPGSGDLESAFINDRSAGPRVHLVDGRPEHLIAMTEGPPA